MKLPPYLVDPTGYCYAATPSLVRDKTLQPWHGRVAMDGFAVPGSEPAPRWYGKTVVCMASGPSLTAEDCAQVKDAGLPAITTNDSWRRAPFAEVMYALDPGWWQQHMHELTTPAERWTASVPAAEEFDLNLHVARSTALNSGARAIELAVAFGAARVLLLGFDCTLAAGTHWHGDHTRTHNPDAQSVEGWHKHFDDVAQAAEAAGTTVINCSRHTALACFQRNTLERELSEEKARNK